MTAIETRRNTSKDTLRDVLTGLEKQGAVLGRLCASRRRGEAMELLPDAVLPIGQ